VKPLSVQGVSPITVVTDNTLKKITIGETHSARTDNPHATTAAQIDTQGGANRLVTQINAGTGVIARARVESAVVSGVVTFENIPFSTNEVSSDDIDPGFGPGIVNVEMTLDDVSLGVTSGGDLTYARTIMFRSEVNRVTGRFRIFASRLSSGTGVGQVKVRWFAFKPTAGSDSNVAVSVSVTPNPVTMLKGGAQGFNATVNNTNNQNVTWAIKAKQQPPPANVGTLSAVTNTSVVYTPPLLSGDFQVVATSQLDPNKTGVADITFIADVFVTVSPSGPTVSGGSSAILSATVFNTTTPGVTWSIRESGNSGTLTVSGNNATYTAPNVTSTTTFHVDAVSAADNTKKGTATITVPAVTVGLNPTSATVFFNETLGLSATVGNTANAGVTWSVSPGGGSISPIANSNNATYTAPSTPSATPRTATVTAKSVADPTKSQSCTITIPVVTISVTANPTFVQPNGNVNVIATIGGTSNTNANWTVTGGTIFPATGPSAVWGSGSIATFTITGTAVADPSKSSSVQVEVSSGEPK
jgi:hypothetical protein